MIKKHSQIFIVFAVLVLVVAGLSGCVQKKNYMVEMRDGIRLDTDVFLPSRNPEPHGSILVRSTYDKTLMGLVGFSWARAGWPTVIQNTRGRFASEGNDTIFFDDARDGYDTVAWVADQSWSNQKVATYGISALGITEYLMAGTNPAALKCQYVMVATPDLYDHAMYWGGEFREKLAVGWLTGQGSSYILDELWENENFSLAYWENATLIDDWPSVNVPAIHVGGWYDIFTQGTIDAFMGYQYLGGAGAQGKSKLILGPWTHGGAVGTQQGELVYPENCVDSFSFALFEDMVDQYTMNEPGSYDSWPAVRYYVMGDVDTVTAPGNEWRNASEWPLSFTERSWYLQENGSLLLYPPTSADPQMIVYDPTDPVPTVGGGNLNMPAGPYDQRGVENRSDVLVFTSPVLSSPYEATGPIKARLFVSSDCPDTDFTVKLTDVYPDGRSMLITDGIVRMRNRNGNDHWEFMQPGEIYEVEVDLWSSSYIWNTGHQIRVSVSSSNYPRFLNNPNTKDGIHANTSYVVANNQVFMNASYPSAILLPEISMPVPSTPPTINSVSQTDTVDRFQTTVDCVIHDADDDAVYVLFDWGDTLYSGWMGPYTTGETITISHQYAHAGRYHISMKTKDATGAQSIWQPLDSVLITQGNHLRNKLQKNVLNHHDDYLPQMQSLINSLNN